MRVRPSLALAPLLCVLAPAATASSGDLSEAAKLVASDAAANDDFGRSVAVSGDVIAVGARGVDEGFSNAGAVYVFERDPVGGGWTELPRLQAGDPGLDHNFGKGVDLDGDTLVVGAWGGDDAGPRSGSAYVFVRDPGTGAWSQQAKLLASDGAAGDELGWVVAVRGDTIALGAPGNHQTIGTAPGAAYVFVRSGGAWSEQQKLVALDAEPGDLFGYAVDVSEQRVVVGARNEDEGAADAGAAYVFLRSGATWSQERKLVATDAAANDRFGYSVAIAGRTVAVGCRDDDDLGAQSGSVHVFALDTATGVWEPQAKLTAPGGAAGDLLGWGVALEEDRLLAGAPGTDAAGASSGVAYVFERCGTSWTTGRRLEASDTAPDRAFGRAVALSGERLVVGALRDDHAGPGSGSAYLFVPPATPGTPLCSGDGSAVACPCGNAGGPGEGCANGAGHGAVLSATGSERVVCDDLVLHAAQARPNGSGLFLQGAAAISAPFRDGILCVGDPTERLEFVALDAAGGAASAVSIVTEGAVQPGQSRVYQLWYRDAMGPCGAGSNLSGALRVDWY